MFFSSHMKKTMKTQPVKRYRTRIALQTAKIDTTNRCYVYASKLNVFKLTIDEAQSMKITIRASRNIRVLICNRKDLSLFSKDGDIEYKNVRNLTDTIDFHEGTWYIKFIHINQTPTSLAFLTINKGKKINTTSTNKFKKKHALLLSISDYLDISDLSYCDEDAVEWHKYLQKEGYENIRVLGDKTSSYEAIKLDDYGTEELVRKHMREMADEAEKGDTFVFASSGHGSGDGKGNSFLCCLDCGYGPDGCYTDKELAEDIKRFTDKGVKVIAIFDNCYSGGMLEEVVKCNRKLVCATSTCTEKGYGFDVPSYEHGAWTYYFLVQTLMKKKNITSLQEAFNIAQSNYPFTQGNTPQIMGNSQLMF